MLRQRKSGTDFPYISKSISVRKFERRIQIVILRNGERKGGHFLAMYIFAYGTKRRSKKKGSFTNKSPPVYVLKPEQQVSGRCFEKNKHRAVEVEQKSVYSNKAPVHL